MDGSQYFHKCWRHAAAFVMSPPLRDDATTGPYLMDLLAKYVPFDILKKTIESFDFVLVVHYQQQAVIIVHLTPIKRL